ncbi:hypothetical protein [Micromonospora sp. WMMD812]|nr:hypothetical protein [Micromonospora sp. WMMD812]WBB69092.1 hypothetical protein O7603_07010 [Micromonospora sp. WMMD812]
MITMPLTIDRIPDIEKPVGVYFLADKLDDTEVYQDRPPTPATTD